MTSPTISASARSLLAIRWPTTAARLMLMPFSSINTLCVSPPCKSIEECYMANNVVHTLNATVPRVLLQDRVQRIETLLPHVAVVRHPASQDVESLAVQLAHPNSPDLVGSQQPGGLQYPQMLGNGRKRHAQRFGQGADGLRSLGNQPDDRAARGVTQRGEDLVRWVCLYPLYRLYPSHAALYSTAKAACSWSSSCCQPARRNSGPSAPSPYIA